MNQLYSLQTSSVWAPHSPPSSPTLLRNMLFPPDHPVLEYMPYKRVSRAVAEGRRAECVCEAESELESVSIYLYY